MDNFIIPGTWNGPNSHKFHKPGHPEWSGLRKLFQNPPCRDPPTYGNWWEGTTHPTNPPRWLPGMPWRSCQVTLMVLSSQVPLVIHVVTAMTSLFLVAVPLLTSPRETSTGLLLLLSTAIPYYLIVVRCGYLPKWLKLINSECSI